MSRITLNSVHEPSYGSTSQAAALPVHDAQLMYVFEKAPTSHKALIAKLARMLALGIAGMALWCTFIGVPAQPTASTYEPSASMSVAHYTVRPGDSLWSIASQCTPDGGNVANTVSTLRELNNLEQSTLRAGQHMVIPTFES